MALDFTSGAIPPFYREVYETVCPNQEPIEREFFVSLLAKSALPGGTLSHIFDLSDNKQGHLSRSGLYKALALCSLAQQGKPINEKTIENFSDSELPRPDIGDIPELKATCQRLRRQKNPALMGLSYQELADLDSVKVDLIPGKKGIILKHVEYDVTSQRYKITVKRRYNDFHILHEVLLQRYPYRIVPSLPPKKFTGVDKEFIEHRRKCLRRFLNIIAKHPVISDDRLGVLKYFFTFNGSDCQTKMKDMFKAVPDEFMTNDLALKAKDLVPVDTQMQYANSRTHIATLVQSVMRLRDMADRMVSRSLELAVDMRTVANELTSMSTDTVPVTRWASGTSDTWHHLKKGFKHLSVEYNALAEKSTNKAANEELQVLEELETFLTHLMAYRDLCERHQKGVLNDHQRALSRMGSIKKKQMAAAIRGPDQGGMEQFESRILAQESAIANMENRNYFSLYCIQMETQLIHSNMMMLYSALKQMATVEAAGYSELSQLWNALLPIVEKILPVSNGNLSPPTSPTGYGRGPPGITM